MNQRCSHHDSGSVSVVLTGVLALLLLAAATAVAVIGVFASQVHVAKAADLAALAGAERAWLDPQGACSAAAAIADAHRVRIDTCGAEGLDVQVSVTGNLPPPLNSVGVVRAVARAGPPE